LGAANPTAWGLVLAGAWTLARGLHLAAHLRHARRLAAAAVPFERRGRPRGPALLVLGDSLSVGVGASSPHRSVAGRIAQACPGLAVVNRARSGARVADVVGQLRAAPRGRWDVVLIAAGGNDAAAGTPVRRLAADADAMLASALRMSPRVVVATAASLGAIPILPWPARPWLERRSRRVRDVLQAACARHGALLVDFFRPAGADPFVRDPDLYFGDDRIHPSTACYELCFRVIDRRTGVVAALRAAALADRAPEARSGDGRDAA
jgi:lysophospholipase L1-like esterase